MSGDGRRAEHPPGGFDPVAASDAELARYGYPRRPDRATQPQAYQRWRSVVLRPTTRTAALFGPPSQVPPRPPGGVINPGGWGDQPGFQTTTQIWAGRATRVDYSQYPIQTMYGTWTVPRIVQPPNGGRETYSCASWIGLDGWDGADGQLIQAGTTVGVVQGSTQNEVWFEWYPAKQKPITNFDFAAGDVISCTIDVTGRDGEDFINEVYVTWSNVTTGKSVDGPQPRPNSFPGYTNPVPAPGFTANWILELVQPTAPSPPAVLPQFGSIYYDDSWAYTDGPEVLLNAGQGSLITMVDSAGYGIAQPVPLNPALTDTAFRVDYLGPGGSS